MHAYDTINNKIDRVFRYAIRIIMHKIGSFEK